MASAYDGMLTALIGFFKFFKWRHIGIIGDYAYYANTFYEQTAAAVKDYVASRYPEFDVDILVLQANNEKSVIDILELTMKRCRGE